MPTFNVHGKKMWFPWMQFTSLLHHWSIEITSRKSSAVRKNTSTLIENPYPGGESLGWDWLLESLGSSWIEIEHHDVSQYMEYDLYVQIQNLNPTPFWRIKSHSDKIIKVLLTFEVPARDLCPQIERSCFQSNDRLVKAAEGSILAWKSVAYRLRIDMNSVLDTSGEGNPSTLIDPSLDSQVDKILLGRHTCQWKYKKQTLKLIDALLNVLKAQETPAWTSAKVLVHPLVSLSSMELKHVLVIWTGHTQHLDPLGVNVNVKRMSSDRTCDRCGSVFYGVGPRDANPVMSHHIGSLDTSVTSTLPQKGSVYDAETTLTADNAMNAACILELS